MPNKSRPHLSWLDVGPQPIEKMDMSPLYPVIAGGFKQIVLVEREKVPFV
jgi:hypothetical protein